MGRATLLSLLIIGFARIATAQWLEAPQSVSFDRGSVNGYHSHRSYQPLSEPSSWPFPNINITNSDLAQTEPCIAINPTDPGNIIVGANDDRDLKSLWCYSSTDSGHSWSPIPLPEDAPWVYASTDPSIAFDRNGTAFFSEGNSDVNGIQNDVVCFRSFTKGTTWSLVGKPFENASDTTSDKYFLTVDNSPTSPYRDRIYITWVDEGINARFVRIVSSYSDDGGFTWSSRKYVTDLGHYVCPIPITEPDGTLLVSFEEYWNAHHVMIARSTDGGISFEAPHAIASYLDLGPFFPNDSTGHPNIGPPDSAMGVNSFPSIAIDRSTIHPGRAYVTWCAKGADNLAHLWLAKSDDNGRTWGTTQPIETDSIPFAHSRFFPWIAVDAAGRVAIDYYVATLTGSQLQTALFLTRSSDGGATFHTRQVSSVWFDPITGQDTRPGPDWFFGDYIGLASASGNWYPVWTDARSRFEDIYIAIVPDSMLDQMSDVRPTSAPQGLSVSFVNLPLAGKQNTLWVRSDRDATIKLQWYDELGRPLGETRDRTLSQEHELTLTPTVAGVEFYLLTEYATTGERKIVGRIGVVER